MGTAERLILSLVLLGLLWVPSGADAQNPSALVLQKTGTTVPDVQPYSEIPVGAVVSLQPGARLVFLHYQTCTTVTAVGSRVAFEGLTYKITGGSKPEETRIPCPPMVHLRGQGDVAGVMLRSISPVVRLSISPSFALVGDRADDFAGVRVTRGGATLLEAPLTGRGFRWPTGTALLTADVDYELVLVPKTDDKTRVTLKFRAGGDTGVAAADQLTLISVD